MSHEDAGKGALGRGNRRCEGPKAGMCLMCLRIMFEEAVWLEHAKGDSDRRGARRGMEDLITWGPAGRCEDLGFSSERNGDPVQGFEERNGMTRFTF